MRWCGVMPRYDEPDKEMKKVKEEEEDEPFPPVREVKDWEVEMRRGEFTVVASDGACPGQQGDSRLRRAAQALYYGEGHSHNCAWETHTYSQGAQRAEIRAAVRWVAWAWGPTQLWTDSALVVRGVQRVLRGEPMA